ncbi:MAG: ABC transporter ATP-binding protein, partial [Planctomycetota bacterium]
MTPISPTADRTRGDGLTSRPEHSAESPLSVHAMTVAYQRKPVLWDVDYDAPPNRLIAIVGPNGAGKSTLIKACLGLVPRASGQVEVWGEPYRRARPRVGYVPQRETVDWDFPVSALDVVCMGRYRKIGWCLPVTRKHKEAAMVCLDRVGMAGYAHRQISQLSGGQQQRVAIARALVNRPALVLADEPTGALDTQTSSEVMALLTELNGQGITVVIVTHEP